MSAQNKIEQILKEIHVLFSRSRTYAKDGDKIVVEKQEVFRLLEQLNMAVYEVMDEYEVTRQKHELSERRSQKRGEEIIEKANRHADDIYAASIMYTDDALSRVQSIMEDASKSVQRIFRKMNAELSNQQETIRQNQSELKEQLRDFADTEKYLKVMEEMNARREKELREKLDKSKGKLIMNEGKSYRTIQPEIKVNKAYFQQTGKHYDEAGRESDRSEEGVSDNLSKITGKDFAETLRRRASRSGTAEAQKSAPEGLGIAPAALNDSEAAEEPKTASVTPEVKVNLDAAYFKQKRSPFGKK